MKIVRVKWTDSVGWSSWRALEDVRRDSVPDAIETVGYLVKSTAKSVTVTQSLGATGNVDNSITIPRCSVKGRVEILGTTTMPKKGAW